MTLVVGLIHRLFDNSSKNYMDSKVIGIHMDDKYI